MSVPAQPLIKDRFRGFLPVVVDIETGGFNCQTDAILEIAVTLLEMDEEGNLAIAETHSRNVEPFEGANLEPSALEFTGIDPESPLRGAVPEEIALGELFAIVRQSVKSQLCNRAVLVGHNAHFDAGFLNVATERIGLKRNPFHPFSYFDTSTLAGLAFGHTVLARACALANIPFDNNEAHSAEYDAMKTAELFCLIVNRWQSLGGWTPPAAPE
ncbi:MAG: ribonuclease T [Luminiphilus sp.]|jgi:ribonuclease T|nr:ribonuclease T [Luminiphilus sp.]